MAQLLHRSPEYLRTQPTPTPTPLFPMVLAGLTRARGWGALAKFCLLA